MKSGIVANVVRDVDRFAANEFLHDYFGRLHEATALTPAIVDRLLETRKLWLATKEQGGKVVFVGNGGSAGIASHLAIDLAKNGNVPAACFNDGGMITCLANDYGFDNWIRHAVRQNCSSLDTLVAISSSGASKNILNAVEEALERGLKVVTLSGFKSGNPLSHTGHVNFWVNSRAYNIVETVHQFLMMSVIDMIIGNAEYPAS